MTRIIMHGFNGKMGKVICSLAEQDDLCQIVAGIDLNNTNAPFPVFTNISDCNVDADVIIDFSTAKAIPELLRFAENKKIPIVLCTTGLDEKMEQEIYELSKKIPIFKSANMSLGINLIANLLRKATKILDENGFDIEIIEKHHNQKIDAPSGTALLLANSINNTMDNKFDYIYDRTTKREKRHNKEIGISSIRGGNIVGEHSVIFAGKDEIIEFNHFAYSKEVFARGAIKAAKFLANKSPAMYDMQSIMEEL